MTEKSFVLRLELRDGKIVAQGLDDIGDRGDRAMQRVGKAAKDEASPGLRALGVVTDDAGDALDRFAARLGPLGRALSAFGPNGFVMAAAIGGFVLLASKVSGAVKSTIRDMDDLADAGDRLRINVEMLQALRLSARDAGFDPAQADSALQSLRDARLNAISGLRGSERALQAFNALGISKDDLQRIGGDLEALLRRVSAGARAMGDDGRAASYLFKLGLDSVAAALLHASGGLDGLLDQLEASGQVIDRELVKRGAEVNQRWDEMTTKLNVAVTPALVALGEVATPVLGFLADTLKTIVDLFGTATAGADKFLQAGALLRKMREEQGSTIVRLSLEGMPEEGAAGVSPPPFTGWGKQGWGSGIVPDLTKAAKTDDAAAKRAAAEAQRELNAALQDYYRLAPDAENAAREYAERIASLDLLLKNGAITQEQYAQAVERAQLSLAKSHGLGGDTIAQMGRMMDAVRLAREEVEKFDAAQEGANEQARLLDATLSGQIRSWEDLLDVLADILLQMIRMAGLNAAQGKGSFWENLVGQIGGFIGGSMGGGGVGSGASSVGKLISTAFAAPPSALSMTSAAQVLSSVGASTKGPQGLAKVELVINNNGAPVEVERQRMSETPGGGTRIEATIRQIVRGEIKSAVRDGGLDRSLAARTGVQPLKTNR